MYCGKISWRSRKVLLANKKIIHLPLPILHEKLNRKMLCVRIPCFKLHLKRSFCYEQFYFTSFAQAFPDDLDLWYRLCTINLLGFLNPFHSTGLFLCPPPPPPPPRTSENLWFSDVFRGYRKRTVAWNGLII